MKIWTQEEEAERLAKRFEGVNQAEFARRYDVPGGASMLSQQIKGRRPINMSSALAYMRGFGVTLEEISPRLARQLALAATQNVEVAVAAEAGAHDLSQVDPIVPTKTTLVSWGDVMKEDLPQDFALRVIDDAMAPLISKGDVVRFSRSAPLRSGRIVLVVDRSGRGYIRTYEAGGDSFDATAHAPGHRKLSEAEDGLRIVAVWMGW